jgi:hypothetical protein
MNIKPKFTRGPWTIGGQGIVTHPQTCAPILTQRIETTLGTIELLDGTNEPEYNAPLIAAAPELLMALESISGACRVGAQNRRMKNCQDIIDMGALADAAIAKARGNT